jgi:hypothetical protein
MPEKEWGVRLGLDVVGVMAFLLISMAFGSIRGGATRFMAACAVVIVASAIVTRAARAEGPDWGFLIAGLALYSFGLLVLRTMLRRSVSLRMLAACAGDRSVASVSQDVASRLGELSRYRLVRRSGPEYRLTAWGRSLTTLLRMVYAVVRLRD